MARLREAVLGEGRWFLADPDEVSLSEPAVTDDLAELDRLPNSRVLVALRGQDLVAVCWLRGGRLRRVAHEAALEIIVGADHRGQGVGRRLLRRAIAWAEGQRELSRLALAVMADNHRAVALYQAHGFVEEGRRHGVVREADGTVRDDLLMARDVSGDAEGLVDELLGL